MTEKKQETNEKEEVKTMSFREKFPSLKDKILMHDSSTGDIYESDGINDEYISVENVEECCKDNQVIRAAITKVCGVMHYRGLAVIKTNEIRHTEHDILEALYRELKL